MIPVVLHHGLFGFGNLQLGGLKICYFRQIDRAIAQRGHPVIVSRVHPTGGIARRARQLKETINRQLSFLGRDNDRIILIAHSLGGLDSRYMISQLDMAPRIAALVTITTPHHGSPYADWCVKNLGQRLGGLRLMNAMGLDVQGINDLTTESCRLFNSQFPDVPGVRCFSVSAARPWRLVPPFLLHAHRIISKAEGDNDGLVSVRSACWGEHLGTWPADHFHTINKRLVLELKDPTGDITPYYLRLLDHLELLNVQ